MDEQGRQPQQQDEPAAPPQGQGATAPQSPAPGGQPEWRTPGQGYPPATGQPGPYDVPPGFGPARPLGPNVYYGPGIPGAVLLEGTVWVPAGFFPRFLAYLLDWALLSILHMLLVLAVGIPQPSVAEANKLSSEMIGQFSKNPLSILSPNPALLARVEEFQRPQKLSHDLLIAICAAYFIIFNGMVGGTMGKLVLGLRVLRRNGQPLGLGIAALRYGVYWFTGWLAYTAWLIPLNSERRALHDIIAGSNVFKPIHVEAPQPLD